MYTSQSNEVHRHFKIEKQTIGLTAPLYTVHLTNYWIGTVRTKEQAIVLIQTYLLK